MPDECYTRGCFHPAVHTFVKGDMERRVCDVCANRWPYSMGRMVGGTIIDVATLQTDKALARLPDGNTGEPWYVQEGRLFVPLPLDYRPYLLQVRILQQVQRAGPEGITLRELGRSLNNVTQGNLEEALRALMSSEEVAVVERRGRRGPATQVWRAGA